MSTVELGSDARSRALLELRASLLLLSAFEASELFLSPHLDAQLLIEATREEGPSMWIVNRSDVYDATLHALQRHPVSGIATRATEKIKLRLATITHLTPPEIERPLEELDVQEAEDLLGHPLCPFEVMLVLSQHASEDVRGSSALSLTRRVLEFPPDWSINPQARETLCERFGELLMNDSSPFVRSYCTRVPLLQSSQLEQAQVRETDSRVRARLLQNPATSIHMLAQAAQRVMKLGDLDDAQGEARVLSLDARLPRDLRQQLHATSEDPFARAAHIWHLEAPNA